MPLRQPPFEVLLANRFGSLLCLCIWNIKPNFLGRRPRMSFDPSDPIPGTRVEYIAVVASMGLYGITCMQT